jgi:hypothetical protein
MTPPILACDTPGLRESLQAAYAMPANYDQPRAVPDLGAGWVLLGALLLVLWMVRTVRNK